MADDVLECAADGNLLAQQQQQPPQHPEHPPSSTATLPEKTDLQRAADRVIQGVIRGAAIGLTLRGGLHVLGAALSAVSRPRRGRALSRAAALEDTGRFAAFLGALAGVYIVVDEGIAAAVGKNRSAKWRGLVAGVCAGPTLLLTGPGQRHHSLATYVLLRGLTLLVRTGNTERAAERHPWLHAALAPTRLADGDTVLMCAACSQILYAFIMAPHTLPRSYVRWIRKQAAKELHVWNGIRELAERTAAAAPRKPLASLAGTAHASCTGPLPCSFFHPGQSCVAHPASLFLPAYRRAVSVYLPVYLLPALLVHRSALLPGAGTSLPILKKLLLGIARSSMFLASFVCLAFGGACAGHHVTGRSTGLIIAASTWVGGLATLLEKKSRRMELALYVTSRALESFARCALEWRWLPAACVPARLDLLLFSAGVGAITHAYSDQHGLHRDLFRSKYLNVLDFVLGSTGFSEGTISHKPSNQDLLRDVGMRVRSLSHTSLQGLALRSASASCLDPGSAGAGQRVNTSGSRLALPPPLPRRVHTRSSSTGGGSSGGGAAPGSGQEPPTVQTQAASCEQ